MTIGLATTRCMQHSCLSARLERCARPELLRVKCMIKDQTQDVSLVWGNWVEVVFRALCFNVIVVRSRRRNAAQSSLFTSDVVARDPRCVGALPRTTAATSWAVSAQFFTHPRLANERRSFAACVRFDLAVKIDIKKVHWQLLSPFTEFIFLRRARRVATGA